MKRELSPKLRKLIAMYREGLPTKRSDIETAWAAAQAAGWEGPELKALYDLVHKLAGSAGSYGFRELSTVARVLDRQLNDAVAGEVAFDPASGADNYATLGVAFDRALDAAREPE